MKKFICLLCIFISVSVTAQFRYVAWNTGIQTGSMSITNAMTNYSADANGVAYITDSIDAAYKRMLNYRVNIEAITPKYFVKAALSLPINKPAEADSSGVYAKNYELNLAFGYGFSIKDVVGFQVGLNLGTRGIEQGQYTDQPHMPKLDYFVPSGSTAIAGPHFFGAMSGGTIGYNVSTVIGFTDNLGMKVGFAHNNIVSKKKTINARNNQVECGLYYANPEWHNIGLTLSYQRNVINVKGVMPAEQMQSGEKLHPASKVVLSCIYLGLNIPIVFGD